MASLDHPDWMWLARCVKCRYPFTGLSQGEQCPECGYELGPGHIALACWTHAGAITSWRRFLLQVVMIYLVTRIAFALVAPVSTLLALVLLPWLAFGAYLASRSLLGRWRMLDARPNCVVVLEDDVLCRVQLPSNLFERCRWDGFLLARSHHLQGRTHQILITYVRDPEDTLGAFNFVAVLDEDRSRDLVTAIEHRIRLARRDSDDRSCPGSDQTAH